MLNPTHLVTLESVSRTGSFAETARELGYTPSAVSQQIQALERQVGRPLFDRAAQGVRPTAMVAAIVAAAQTTLAELSSLSEFVQGLVKGERGQFAIGSFATASVGFVSAALARLIRELPDVAASLVEGEPDELVPLVIDGTLDLGVVYEYVLAPRMLPPELVSVPLMVEPLHLLASARGGEGLDPARDTDDVLRSFADAPWISSAKGTGGADALERMCATYGFAPQVGFRTNNYDVVRELVARDLGVAVVPELGLRAHDGVAARILSAPRAFRRVSLVQRRGIASPIAGRASDILVAESRRRAGAQG